jgi:hypothetical protein
MDNPITFTVVVGCIFLFELENFRSTKEWNFVFELKGILEFQISEKKLVVISAL